MRGLLFALMVILAACGCQPTTPALDTAPLDAVSAGATTVPLVVLTGDDSRVTRPAYRRVTSAAEWAQTWSEHGGAPLDVRGQLPLEMDFDRCLVVAVFPGQSFNSRGLRIDSVRETDESIVVRFDDLSYGTSGPDGGADRATPYAFIVLPKSQKAIVLEEDVRGLKNQPPVWEEVARLRATTR